MGPIKWIAYKSPDAKVNPNQVDDFRVRPFDPTDEDCGWVIDRYDTQGRWARTYVPEVPMGYAAAMEKRRWLKSSARMQTAEGKRRRDAYRRARYGAPV